MGLYSTSIDLGFCSWFSILVFALGFCSRFFPMYVSRLGMILRVTSKVLGKDGCYYQDTTNELKSGCFHHFVYDSSALKRLKEICCCTLQLRSRSEVQSFHMGLYSTSIDLGFCSWFSILVYAQWFCSRLGRTLRVTEKVLLRVSAKVRGIVRGHGKSL